MNHTCAVATICNLLICDYLLSCDSSRFVVPSTLILLMVSTEHGPFLHHDEAVTKCSAF